MFSSAKKHPLLTTIAVVGAGLLALVGVAGSASASQLQSASAVRNEPPSTPGTLSDIPTDTTGRVLWTGAHDSDGTIAGYNVYVDGVLSKAGVTASEWTVTGLTPDTVYNLDVRAVDNLGKVGAPATIRLVTSAAAVVVPPVAPATSCAPGTLPTSAFGPDFKGPQDRVFSSQYAKVTNGVIETCYPVGSSAPSSGAPGGAQVHLATTASPAKVATLSYDLKFPIGFEWVKGGKLPGLCGGQCWTGADNGAGGYAARLMWRADGAAEVLVNDTNTTGFGSDLGRGVWSWSADGKFHTVTEKITQNTAGKADGGLVVMVDGATVFTDSTVKWGVPTDSLMFSTFYGGSDSSWAPTKTSSVQFRNFKYTAGTAAVTPAAVAATNLPPSAPAGNTINVGSTAVRQAWGLATDPDGSLSSYQIMLNGAVYMSVPTSPRTFTIYGLTPGTNYTVGVRGVDNLGLAGPITGASVLTPTATLGAAPAAVTGIVRDTATTQTSLKVDWNAAASSGTSSYRLYFDGKYVTTNYGGDWTDTFHTWSGLAVGSSHTVGVQTIGGDGQLAATTTVTLSTLSAVVSAYPTHTNIVSTSFWVGEIFNANLSDGSQVCSTYDSKWALHHTGVTIGNTPASASGCAGSPVGGCDGVSTGTTLSTFKCATEARTAANGFFPTAQPKPLENPFYLDLPFDDLNDPTAFANRCTTIPWAAAVNASTGVNHCADTSFSYMKNMWVKITGPNGQTAYGQIEDAGPSSGSLYHDSGYVFGSNDARPVNTQFSGDPSQGAGMDVSPALNGVLGFASLDGDNDHVSWSFVDRANVPAGPWLNVVTTSQVTN
jgi:hypothetical protein